MVSRVPAFLLCTLFVAASSAAKVRVASDPDVDLASYETYGWRTPVAAPNPTVDRLVRAAADDVLAKKGLRLVKEGEADLLLDFRVGSIDTLYSGIVFDTVWWGALVFKPGGRSSVEGGILLFFVDAETEEAVWGGVTTMRGNTPDALQVMRDRAGKETRKILGKFPKVH